MGTRADFYVGRGREAKWLGSVAFDGYPTGIDLTLAERETRYGMTFAKHEPFADGEHLFDSKTVAEFLERVGRYFANREDVTLPAQGWPWPWETSHTTDYAYAFDDGAVHCSCFGSDWYDPRQERGDDWEPGGRAEFPDMTDIQNVTFGARSGVIVFSSP